MLRTLWERSRRRDRSYYRERPGVTLTRFGNPGATIRLVQHLEDLGLLFWDTRYPWDLRITDAGAMAISERI